MRCTWLFTLFCATALAGPTDSLDRYNVIWTSPSGSAAGSMPAGNGDIGINVWAEMDGGILLYLSKTDAWDEHARLVKLGRIRIRFKHDTLGAGLPFRQELRLRQGEIVIGAGGVTTRIWVDANRPVVRVEAASAARFTTEASLEIWRTARRDLPPAESSGVDGFTKDSAPVEYPDTVAEAGGDRVVWYHRNRVSLFPVTLRVQGLSELPDSVRDPLLNRTFGAAITGSGMRRTSSVTLASAAPSTSSALAITVLTAQTATPGEWLARLESLRRTASAPDPEAARVLHRKWWNEFWNRSWMRLESPGTQEAADLSLGWHLNRYQNACAGRGPSPLKFNGSIFNVDGRHPRDRVYAGYKVPAGTPYTADYRDWGGCYWFQNTRHMYWPMLAAGDFDMMLPLFRMYRDMLPLARRRTRVYFGHEGAFFPETLYFWGAYFNADSLGYGWDREGKPAGVIGNGYTRYYWQGGLELLAMMLDYHAATRDRTFAGESLIPFAREVTAFYDLHYRRERGRMRIEPANALETFWDVVNPTPEIAGLERCLKGLLDLPAVVAGAEWQNRWRRMLGELPAYPVKEKDGKAFLDAAEIIRDKTHNAENVAMWAVFPYRIFGPDKPQLDMIRNTFLTRPFPNGYGCWGNDNTSAAYLGLASEARKRLAERFLRHGEYRFPVFYTQGDWTPDIDNGGNAQQALQAMLMQADRQKILLFPAWPRQWDVEFKLNAAMNTTVEGSYRAGRLRVLKVEPPERRADVVELRPQ